MTSQTAFRAGLLNPTIPAPTGLQDGAAGPSGKRYDVYRNNVTHSLVEALRTAFPLIHKLIGTQRFTDAAVKFVRTHPPSSPLMMFYGAKFPDFLAEFTQLTDIGYLADAARLDLALRHSYHAADTPALAPETLQEMPPEALMTATFALAPATRILRSPWPLYDIWRVNFQQDAPKPQARAQNVLITRPAFDPIPQPLPAGGAEWLEALAAGRSFAEALETASAFEPAFDLQATLTLALSSAALSSPNHKDLK